MVLDIMRREKKLLLGLLLVPLILGLVAYLIPGLPGGVWGRGVEDSVLAKVGRTEVSSMEFRNLYQRFLKNNRMPDRQFLKTLQIDRQILNQLINKGIIQAEAKRLGIDATANDIQQKILSLPYFSENGSFVFNRYEAVLRQNQLTVEEFEDSIREEIIREKLNQLVTDGVTVSDKDVEEEYRNRNEKAKVSYVAFDPASFTKSVNASDAELKAYYDKHKESYRTSEQRKVRYLLVDANKTRSGVQTSEAELRQYYQQNIQSYQLPEQVRAAHILFKTQDKPPEEVEKIKAKANDVLAQAKKGADFAELAKKYSEDTSAANGGDLGLFGRGQMVPEFDKEAFRLPVGGFSELVKTTFGFHIIKVLDKQRAHTQTFEEVASLIQPTLVQRKADQAAQQLADKAYSRARSNQNFEQISKELGLTIEETPWFSESGTIPGIGNSQEFASRSFSMKPKEVGSPVRIPQGFAIPQLIDVKAPYIPDFAEAHSRVEQDLKSSKAGDLARSKAQEFAEKAKAGGKFESLAKEYQQSVKTSEDFTRNGSIPDLGSTAPLDSFAFSATPGQVNDVLTFGQKQVVVQLKSRTPISSEEFAKAKDGIRSSMLAQKKDEVFQAYLENARDKMTREGKIKVNEQLFAELSRRI